MYMKVNKLDRNRVVSGDWSYWIAREIRLHILVPVALSKSLLRCPPRTRDLLHMLRLSRQGHNLEVVVAHWRLIYDFDRACATQDDTA